MITAQFTILNKIGRNGWTLHELKLQFLQSHMQILKMILFFYKTSFCVISIIPTCSLLSLLSILHFFELPFYILLFF